jgi:hypothetical protein
MTKDEAQKLEALKYAASMGYGRDLLNMISAPFTIKEALAQPVQEPSLQEQLTKAYADMEKACADRNKANDDRVKANDDFEKAYYKARRIEAKLKEKNT